MYVFSIVLMFVSLIKKKTSYIMSTCLSDRVGRPLEWYKISVSVCSVYMNKVQPDRNKVKVSLVLVLKTTKDLSVNGLNFGDIMDGIYCLTSAPLWINQLCLWLWCHMMLIRSCPLKYAASEEASVLVTTGWCCSLVSDGLQAAGSPHDVWNKQKSRGSFNGLDGNQEALQRNLLIYWFIW